MHEDHVIRCLVSQASPDTLPTQTLPSPPLPIRTLAVVHKPRGLGRGPCRGSWQREISLWT